MSAELVRGTAWEDSAVVLMARIANASGSNITQASTTSITYSVWESGNSTAVVTSTSLTPSAVVFDTLQTPTIWTTDSTGYNFRHDPPASALPNGGKTYTFEYRFDPSSGEDFSVVFEVSTKDLRNS